MQTAVGSNNDLRCRPGRRAGIAEALARQEALSKSWWFISLFRAECLIWNMAVSRVSFAGQSIPAYAKTVGRAVHIKIYPRPRNLAESREVLRVLQQYGEVVMYKHLKVGCCLLLACWFSNAKRFTVQWLIVMAARTRHLRSQYRFSNIPKYQFCAEHY